MFGKHPSEDCALRASNCLNEQYSLSETPSPIPGIELGRVALPPERATNWASARSREALKCCFTEMPHIGKIFGENHLFGENVKTLLKIIVTIF